MIKKPYGYRKVLLRRLSDLNDVAGELDDETETDPLSPELRRYLQAARDGVKLHRGRLKSSRCCIRNLEDARKFLDGWYRGLTKACGLDKKKPRRRFAGSD